MLLRLRLLTPPLPTPPQPPIHTRLRTLTPLTLHSVTSQPVPVVRFANVRFKRSPKLGPKFGRLRGKKRKDPELAILSKVPQRKTQEKGGRAPPRARKQPVDQEEAEEHGHTISVIDDAVSPSSIVSVFYPLVFITSAWQMQWVWQLPAIRGPHSLRIYPTVRS